MTLAERFSTVPPRRIFVPMHPTIGDVVALTAPLRWLRDRFPDARIVGMTSAQSRPLAEACGSLDEVWVRPRGLAGRLSLVARLRRCRFDLGVQLYGQNQSMLVMALGGVRTRIGVEGSKYRRLYHASVRHREGEHSVTDTTGRLLRMLGCDTADARPHLPTPPFKLPLPPYPRVAFMTGASVPGKVWPIEHFQQVWTALAGEGFTPVLIGGPAEAAVHSALIGAPESFAGRTDVLQTAALLRECALLVTNDTGAMHIAGAVGTPIVAVFGPSRTDHHSPWGAQNALLRGTCDCPIRDGDLCPGRCTASVTPGQVLAEARRLLADRVVAE